MDYYFINSDAGSFRGRHELDTWFSRKLAFTGGEPRFGEQLGQLMPDDICLMYENGVGVVGVGRVLEKWDRKAYKVPIYYVSQDGVGLDGIDEDGSEYRIRMDWFLDLRTSPINLDSIATRLGYIPRGAVKRILKHRPTVEMIIAEKQSELKHRSHGK